MTGFMAIMLGAAALGAEPAGSASAPDSRAIIEKNIFLPNVPKEAEPEPEPEPDVPYTPAAEVVLTGLMYDGSKYVALLEDKADRRGAWVAAGDDVGTWRVDRIEMTRLRLTNDAGDSKTLTLGETVAAVLPPPPDEPGAAPGQTDRPSAIASGSSSGRSSSAPSMRSIEEMMRERRRRERGRM